MPQIVVTTDDAASGPGRLLKERIAPSDLDSDHFSAQLVERLGWAIVDADELEHLRAVEARKPSGRFNPAAVR